MLENIEQNNVFGGLPDEANIRRVGSIGYMTINLFLRSNVAAEVHLLDEFNAVVVTCTA